MEEYALLCAILILSETRSNKNDPHHCENAEYQIQ